VPAESNAAVVEHVIRAGAVVLGKTVTQEFAAGVISAPARNPWDQSLIPGGSSGGSAAAVAVRAAFGALGSDTGGSIRIPAAACGVTGFKPTFGALSLDGVYPLSWSLDTAGPIARTVDDTWLLWKTLQAEGNMPAFSLTADIPSHGFRVGLPRKYFLDSVQPSVREVFDTALSLLTLSEVSVVDVDWPLARAAHACSFIINRVETASVHLQTAIEEPEMFRQYGADLRVRVAAGSLVPASAYIQAQRLRAAFRDSMAHLFETYHLDALIVPTLPTAPVDAERLLIEETGLEESLGAAWTRLTMPFNATGQPVLSIPGGLDRNGLPVGLQLAGKPGAEEVLFQIGRAVEDAVAFPHSNFSRLVPASS
jgi:aspartyl-tRNA(Asn)/glutamyl-tRNA(Gln) amidotransferase subunit A